MNIKKRFHILLIQTNKVIELSKEAEKDIKNNSEQKNTLKHTKKLLEKILALETEEIKELNESLKNIAHDDEEVLAIIKELSQDCHNIINKVREMFINLNNKSLYATHHIKEVELLFETLKELEKKKKKAEEIFFKSKTANFEEKLEKTGIKLPKKRSKQQIRNVKNMFLKYNDLPDLKKAEVFQSLIQKIGPEKAEKYFKRIFSYLSKGEKVANNLRKINPQNKLIKEGETALNPSIIQIEQVKITRKDKIKLPYRHLGFPRSSDLAFILTNGMVFSAFVGSLTGPLWVTVFAAAGSLSGLLALVTVTAITFYIIKKRITIYPNLLKKTLNLIYFIKSGGDIKEIYGVEDNKGMTYT